MVIDCAEPGKLAECWAVVLGYQLEPPPTGYRSCVVLADPEGNEFCLQ